MHSKKYQEASKSIDPKKLYSPEEAVELLKKISKTKFDASVEAHAHLGIDLEKSEQQIRSTVVFPHGTGKTKIVAAFVEAGKEDEAKSAGADVVGGEELIGEIAKSSKYNFEVAVAMPSMMPKLAKVAKILGPKGLMPNPKDGTVSPDVKKMVTELKKGKLVFKSDKGGNVHAVVGKISFDSPKLLENFKAFFDALKRTKPSGLKGNFIETVSLSTTMSPSVRVTI